MPHTLRTDTGLDWEDAAALGHGPPSCVGQPSEEQVWARMAGLAMPSCFFCRFAEPDGLPMVWLMLDYMKSEELTTSNVCIECLHLGKLSAVHLHGPCILRQPLPVPTQPPG